MSWDNLKTAKEQQKPQIVKSIFQILLSLLVLGCAAALATHYMQSSPKAKPRPRSAKPPLVQTMELLPQDLSYEFDGMGTVTGAREIGITPRVNGEVVRISANMVPGGRFLKGDELFKIDPTDYEIALLQQQTDVARVKSDLDLEMGNQRIAQKEFELLGQRVSETEKELMLRKPQLGIAEAAVASAEAKLRRAQLDLQRTSVVAPFNGIIISRNVDLGSRVNSSSPVGQLVGTDQFWVKVSLPVEQLKWLTFPERPERKGSFARIYLRESSGSESFRQGNVIRLAADLESEGRMAVVYVAVEDPLCLKAENSEKEKLFLGSFVRARFEGEKLQQVYAIHRDHLHERETIWLLSEGSTLEIKEIDIVARSASHVYTKSNLGENPQLITSQISTPTAGTPLQLAAINRRKEPQEVTE